MKIHIVGSGGLFGSFLKELLSDSVEFDENAEHVVLSVPFHAYEEVAEKYQGKHLINVCSVQEDTTTLCQKYSDRVTGFHPLFGPKSPEEGRTAVLTHTCDATDAFVDLFRNLNVDVVTELPDGRLVDGKLHDQMMALVHMSTAKVVDELRPIVEEASWVPENCLPTSFKRMRGVVRQWEDISPGTLESILANKYLQ